MRTIRALSLGLVALALADCSRSKEPEPESAPVAPRPSASVIPLSSRYARPSPEHLVAIGDLHGDLDVTRRALRLAGAIDEKDSWVGKNLVLVQTGDEIDRGDDDRKILDLFERLKVEAKAAGGEVLALVGNHEIMNASLDFRYVTPAAFTSFGDILPPEAMASRLTSLDERSRGRAAAFLPGGRYAGLIAGRPMVVRVGDSVFVHGGVLPKHLRYGLDRINDEVRDWLLGKRPDCPAIVTSEDGPVWTRMYSAATGREECAILEEVLASTGAKRMVVGHTVQRDGISSTCDGRVWRIDTGLSKFFGGKLEVLDIRTDVVSVRRVETAADR
jgi:hypothetical protein